MSHVRITILIAVLSSVGSVVWAQEARQDIPRFEQVKEGPLPLQNPAGASYQTQPMQYPLPARAPSPSAGTSLLWFQPGLPVVGEHSSTFSQSEQFPTATRNGSPQAIPSNLKSPIHLTWCSDRFQHERLLFEEPRLERQGISHVAPVQLVESSTKFFTKSVLFPFAWTLGLHRQPESSK